MKPEERKSNEIIIQNLKYIEKCVQHGTYKESGAILALLICETLDLIKVSKVFCKVPYTSNKLTNEYYTFSNTARQSKAKLLCDLEEVRGELASKKTNEKRVLVLIQRMLQTELYNAGVQEAIGSGKTPHI
ncbi:hypothetical protein ACQCVE_00280 [Metabacillus sp. 113a]|uniref:hypothetical protein n=1 Tax=Metabacillus sp. 113a TaxID=3404706 RepID=UPI003CEE858B